MLPDRSKFRRLASRGNAIVLSQRLLSDQLTPVLAYRRLVQPDERTAPSFLLESVENGATVGRHSFIGAQPSIEICAREHSVDVRDHRSGVRTTSEEENPLAVPARLTAHLELAGPPGGASPPGFFGGWVGYAGYDTARYMEPQSLPFSKAPEDDRDLPDMHFGFYRQVAAFDHVAKVLTAMSLVILDEHADEDAAWRAGCEQLETFCDRLQRPGLHLPDGRIDLDLTHAPEAPTANMSREAFEGAVEHCREYIAAGDAFQIVLSQRFERRTTVDPFEIYRALRIVNPSPYMIYLQGRGVILVASSPEILCRTERGVVTNRPLAGTRKRGASPEQDAAFERDLLADDKERSEHVMLVDLGRNDLGRVCRLGSIQLPAVLQVERYSHVMHLSSTVTGRLRDDLTAWDALGATLPVGTVSGAPKVRAMQIIDELEPTRRGPYAGGIGVVGIGGDMDVALALRTMVIPTEAHHDGSWTVHLQAGAGIVADSDPALEYQETVNKAAALGRALDLAERMWADAV